MKKLLLILSLLIIAVGLINFYSSQYDSTKSIEGVENTELKEPVISQPEQQELIHKEEGEKTEKLNAPETVQEGQLSLADLMNNQEAMDDVYVPPVPLTEEEKALHEKLEKLGHIIPIEYYNYGLDTLKSLAENGDSNAAFHLGERYYFQLLNDPAHMDYDSSMDYKATARDAFSRALQLGNRHAAAVISELNMMEKNHEDAYSWHLLAEDLGDTPATEWFKHQEFYADITEEQKQKAYERYQALRQQYQEQWINDGQESLFN
ncbi:hypothetical protein [Aliikangiella sp. IMCC44359]|uniref:hypothetical protein n=1 Tax=Aliikangiella sp. IMCC44359 TaxID=3459125 RepID=UPI00403ACD8D